VSAQDPPDTGREELTQEQAEEQTEDQTAGPRYGRRRRAPRYGSFVFTGVLIGIVLALIVSFSRPATGQFSQNSVVGYVAAIFGLTGALIGAGAAIFFDRRKPPTT
jgi:hypothetical protein